MSQNIFTSLKKNKIKNKNKNMNSKKKILKKKIYVLIKDWHDGSEPKNIRAYQTYSSALVGIKNYCQKLMKKDNRSEHWILSELFDPTDNEFSCFCIIHKDDEHIPHLDKQPFDWKKIVCPSIAQIYLEELSLIE